VAVLDYSAAGPVSLPPNPTAGDPISGSWSGWIEAPQSGFYNVAIEVDAGATITLRLAGASVTLAQAAGVWTNQTPISLTAGTLHAVTLTVERVTDRLALRWETTGQGWEPIPARLLYSADRLGRLHTTWVRFLKAVALASALRLSPAEVAHFASHPDHRVGGEGWLNALAVTGAPSTATAQALREVLVALLGFVRIRAASAPGEDELVSLLEAPAATLPSGESALPVLLGWDAGSLGTLLTRFGLTLADLGNIDALRRVHDAYALVRTSGIPAVALIAATINDPPAAALQGLEAAVRARYDRDGLLDVIKEVHDELRDVRRDALVAYVLHGLAANPATSHIDTPDKLFEFFLMDVQMEPCMQTSRIRHALSSVQLFADRCLMNLEPRVAASSIDAGRWEWMKRYRVWEANRVVFCFPENLAEPELRDDQSPFFRETIGELLQGDITEDAAAIALVRYLTKLEEVAQLEPCGMHFSEGIAGKLTGIGPTEDVAHVVARTPGGRRTHYYRSRRPSGWTPWERIPLEIEDNPVIPAVWRNRLFLFWLRILRETPVNPAGLPTTGRPGGLAGLSIGDLKSEAAADARAGVKVGINAVLCWSEYYDGRWQPAKSSDPNRPTELGLFDTHGSGAFDRTALRLGVSYAFDDSLRVWISGSGNSSFAFYNTHSPPVRGEDAPAPPQPPAGTLNVNWGWKWADKVGSRLHVAYQGFFLVNNPYYPPPAPFEHDVLEDAWPFDITQARHVLLAPWPVPFFLADSRRVYWVTPQSEMVTIQGYNGFGVVVPQTGRKLAVTSPLVLKADALLEARASEVQALSQDEPGFGVLDPVHVRRFVGASPTIHRGLASSDAVRYGDKTIGPAGALP
jgi:hypothetical protein